jgi:hypothetical protein
MGMAAGAVRTDSYYDRAPRATLGEDRGHPSRQVVRVWVQAVAGDLACARDWPSAVEPFRRRLAYFVWRINVKIF